MTKRNKVQLHQAAFRTVYADSLKFRTFARANACVCTPPNRLIVRLDSKVGSALCRAKIGGCHVFLLFGDPFAYLNVVFCLIALVAAICSR